MVVSFDLDSQRLHRQRHLGARLLHTVDGRNRKVAFFLTWLVAKVRGFLLARIPDTFLRVDLVVGEIHTLVVAHLVEYKEFRFRSEIGRIGNAGLFEMCLGLLSYVAGVAAVSFT